MSLTVPASKLPSEPINWLWQERIPAGMITLVGGRSNAGKSLFAAYVAADLSQLGYPVIISAVEDHPSRVTRPRLQAMGSNLHLIHIIPRSQHPKFPEDAERVRQEIRDRKARLFVLDPVGHHLSRSIFNGQEVRDALDPLIDLAQETDVAILLIHHLVKGRTRNSHSLDAFGGASGGLQAVMDQGYIFGISPDDGDERILATAKSRIGSYPKGMAFDLDSVEVFDEEINETLTPAVLRLLRDDLEIDGNELLRVDAKQGPSVKLLEEATKWLLQALRDGPRNIRELYDEADTCGIKGRTLRRAAKEQVEVVRKPEGKPETWELPPHFPRGMIS
jgi:hypothetical protein